MPTSAGTGNYLDDENFTETEVYEPVPEKADFGVYLDGDSMEPLYLNGQLVWVQRCTHILPGEVGLFVVDGEGYIKKYEERIPEDKESYTDSEGVLHKQIVLVPLNEDYDEIIAGENNALTIAGRVLN